MNVIQPCSVERLYMQSLLLRHMRRAAQCLPVLAGLGITLIAGRASGAADPVIDWWTVDGGGWMFSNGAEIELGGTFGQPDAGVVSNGDIELSGGFWLRFQPGCADFLDPDQGIYLEGDVTQDEFVDGVDVGDFVDCLIGPFTASCECADLDDDGAVNSKDIAALVQRLLTE